MSSHESSSGTGDQGAADFFGNERFELEEMLGEGAYGVVYQALDRVREARIALKVLRRLGPDALFYFKKEFRALADIQHPNLVRYYELFEERGRWFLTMELLRGSSFVEYVRAGHSPVERAVPRFDEQRLRHALPQLSAALSALHTAGKVHRDVKPSNVRVTPNGRVVLLDFGLVLDTDARESTRLPRVGTASFMAPEQVAGAHVGPEADYYAVGAMLYECLTGQHPFVGDAYEVLHEKQMRDPGRPSEVAPFVPLDLDELCMALLMREPEERRSGIEALSELTPRLSRTSLSVPAPRTNRAIGFVGRTRELSALSRLLGQLEDGHVRAAYVHGESGAGKSALLAEFARRTREERPDAVILTGRCYERETVPYKAFDGVVDALARHLRRLSDERVLSLLPPNLELLAQAFPVLARVPRIRERVARDKLAQERGEGNLARRRAFSALRLLLSRLGESAPLVVAIDDMHRADVDSLSLLEDLLVPNDLPALFVLFGRPSARREESSDDRDPLGFASGVQRDAGNAAKPRIDVLLERLLSRTPQVLRLRLGALAESDSCVLAEALLGEQSGPRELALSIAREASGQPLFVSTLVHFVSQSGTRSIPTLDEALRASVSALSLSAQKLVSLVAVAGAPIGRDVLGRVLRIDGDVLQAALDEAISTQWFRLLPGELGGGIELAHERMRDGIVGRLDPEEIRELHQRLAEALSRLPAHAEAAAFHWAEAGAHEEVVTFARSAARQAVASLAFGKAVRLYELSLLHVDVAERALCAELTEMLGDALSLSGRVREAAERYAEAAQLSEREQALELRLRAATEWLSAGDEERAVHEVETLLGELGVSLPRSRRGLLFSLTTRRTYAYLRGLRWDARTAEELSPRQRLRVDALWTLTLALSSSDALRALELEARHLDAALELGEPYRLVRALALDIWLTGRAGSADKLLASDELRYAKELAQQSGHPHALALVELVHACGYAALGRQREAIRCAEAADVRLRDECRGGIAWERSQAQHLALASRFDGGDFRGLSEALKSLAREAENRSERPFLPGYLTRFLCWESLLGDEPDQARARLERERKLSAGDGFGEHRFYLLTAHTELDLYVGDPNACARVERAWNELESSHMLSRHSLKQRALFLRARAALGSAYLMPHQRPRLLAIAQRQALLLDHDSSEVSRALSSLSHAGVAELSADREQALILFGEAALACESAGMAHYAAVARRRQGTVLGGEDGRAMVVRAERFLREQGAVDPGRIAALLLGY